jgi:hypothetical protein
MLYLLSEVNVRLRPKLLWELRPGSRLVINHFDIGDWKPDATLHAHHRELSLFIVPAWVAGKWDCVIGPREGRPLPAGHRRFTLHLRRQYQVVRGTARVGRHEVPVSDARLVGDRLSFTIFHPTWAKPAVRYTCSVGGGVMRGACHVAGEETSPHPWGGVRVAAG